MLYLLSAFSTLALAEEPTFLGAAAVPPAPPDKPVTHLSAALGGTLTTGNAESLAVNAGITAEHKWDKNAVGLVGGAAVGKGAVDANADGFLTDAERCIGVKGRECADTAERYALDLRYDRYVSEKSSVYVLAGALHDKFAGFELRSHAQLGVAEHVVSTDTTRIKVEAGADFANEAYVPGVVPASTRLLAVQIEADAAYQFNPNVGFSDAVTVYEPVLTQPDGTPFAPHFTDVRVTNVATLNAKMTDKLSISVVDTLGWRNEPVAPPVGVKGERAHVDNTATIALVAALL